MGEVYRANDMKLGQPVALKFLPESTAGNQQMLARLHAEVRIARQVSHPNVCRVYDISELDGAVFFTMEYVDGEDLGSLLRRIGRLPADKGVEIARRLCAGLAAAHDKGVLHRDLKPANVMIDGRGQVLLTDFGLAGLSGQLEGGEIRNGTPAYMAPEQLAGREVTARSDIYALGLLLYEMFTGKRAFEGARRGAPATISSLVKDIDPAVERVITRCIEEDPRNRPASALAVAAALPGGDPLAAALAAGETPSPEMVASAGESEFISVRTAVICLAVVITGLVATAAMFPHVSVLEKTAFELSPDALTLKARDIISGFGYSQKAADSASQWLIDWDFQQHAARHETKETIQAQLASAQPPFIYFSYRQSPEPLATFHAEGRPTVYDPPLNLSGMVNIQLDGIGRLRSFDAVPLQGAETAAPESAPFDWTSLFTAAGLDPGRFREADPQWLPSGAFDARAAWTGSYPDTPHIPVRIEAAAWRGKPVYFQLVLPWTRPERTQRYIQTTAQQVTMWGLVGIISILFVIATAMAWRSYQQGRGDMRGASRVAAVIFVCSLVAWICRAKHVPAIAEFEKLIWANSSALFSAAAFWVLYVALEPYARRRWPQSLISWTRLLSGRIRDPLVGGHVLIGVAFSMVLMLANNILNWSRLLQDVYLEPLQGARFAAGALVEKFPNAILPVMFQFFLFFLLRALLRRQWLAFAVFLLLVGLLGAMQLANPVLGALQSFAVFGATLLVLVRYGLLSLVVCWLMPHDFPLTINLSAWYAGYGIIPLATILGLTIWAFYTALAGRPLLREGFLDS